MDKSLFNIKIVTPNNVYKDIIAERLTIQTKEGMVTILARHTEYLTTLEVSTMEIFKDGETSHYAIEGGVLHFYEDINTAILVVKSFCPVEELNINELEKEKNALNEKIKNTNSEIEHKSSELELKRAINRINALSNFKK